MESPTPPKDFGLRNIIEKLAEFVARNGPEFETITKQKQQGNPKFEFLYGGEFAAYYQFRKQNAEQSYLNNQNSVCQSPHQAHLGYQQPQMSLFSQGQEPSHYQQQLPRHQSWTPNIPISIENGGLPINVTSQIESINMQQNSLRDQIRQSESNLSAQHSALLAQQTEQIDEAIDAAQNLFLENQAEENKISLKEFDVILQPIIESCTKDSISAGKNWILQHSLDNAKNNVVLQYLLKKALLFGSTFQQKLHLIYLVNDILHHCIRKNVNELKNSLENIVIPMFCSADLIANDDQRSKLTKLLALWETKAKFFDACVITKLQSPDSSMQEYKTNLQNQHHEIIAKFSHTTKSALENYQKQHQIFIQHATQQINQLEQQKQQIEQQMMSSVMPSTSSITSKMQVNKIPSLMSQKVLMPSVENLNNHEVEDSIYNDGNNTLYQQSFNEANEKVQAIPSAQQNSYSSELQSNFFIPDLTKPPPGFLGNVASIAAQLPTSLQQQFVQLANLSLPNISNTSFGDNTDTNSEIPFDVLTLNAALRLVKQQQQQQHSHFLTNPEPSHQVHLDEELPPPAPRITDEILVTSSNYYDLPAGLIVPLIRLEDYNYKPLDPADIQFPSVVSQNDRLTNALAAFYSPPTHDRPRDTEGWEKLGLYEYYKVKNAAKKQKEEDLSNGLRLRSRSPSPIISKKPKQKRNKKRCYRSKSRTRSRSNSPVHSRSPSRSPSTRLRDSKNGRNNWYSQKNHTPRRSPAKDHELESPDNLVERNNIKFEEDRCVTPPNFFNNSFGKFNDAIEESNKGHQMLTKMGWAGAGTGLGTKNQGIDQPISRGEMFRDRKDMYKGVGVNLNDPFENFRKNKGVAFVHRMRTRDEKN